MSGADSRGFLKRARFRLLLTCLAIAILGLPLLADNPVGRFVLHGWALLTLGTLVLSLPGDRKSKLPGIILGIASIGIALLSLAGEVTGFDRILLFRLLLPFSAGFFIFCTLQILHAIFRAEAVDGDLLCGAVVGYILLGIAWATVCCYIESAAPGSYSGLPEGDFVDKLGALFYFSFVTLTTLGYGDILPTTGISRAAAHLEAITGVMYASIFVAALVGNWGKRA